MCRQAGARADAPKKSDEKIVESVLEQYADERVGGYVCAIAQEICSALKSQSRLR